MPPYARRLGVEADRAHLVAERRAVEHHPEDDQRGERDEDADVQALSSGSPQNDRQLRAPRTTSLETGTDCCRVAFCSGPPSPNRYDADPDRDPVEHDRRDHLVGARRSPSAARRSRPRRAGQRSRATIASDDVQQAGMPVERRADPDARRSMPTRYWPWPPMLNRPQRNANATARPVRISGVVRISVCWRFSAASVAVVAGRPTGRTS